MDRNSIIGFVLIAMILIGWGLMNQPSEEELEKARKEEKARQAAKDSTTLEVDDDIEGDQTVQADSIKPTNDSIQAAVEDTLMSTQDSLTATLDQDSLTQAKKQKELEETYGIFAGSVKGDEQLYTVENDKIRVTFSNKGGSIVSTELKEYNSYDDFMDGKDRPLRMFDQDSSTFRLNFILNGKNYNTNEFILSSSISDTNVTIDEEGKELRFRLEGEKPEQYIEMIYSLEPNSYELDYDVIFKGLDKAINPLSVEVDWTMKAISNEKLIDNERNISTVFFRYQGEGRDYLSERGDDELNLEATVDWVSFKQYFFSAFLMSDEGFPKDAGQFEIKTLNSGKYIKEYHAIMRLPLENTAAGTADMAFYFGPNHYQTLARYDREMEGIINLGWGIFGWVNKYLVIPIFNFLEGIGLGYGIIIFVLTVLIKMILFPLTYKNYKSSAKMRVLRPEIDSINEKYKDKDPMKKQQATMSLYRSTGVNPMAGCVPMLIQLPILYAMFRFFPSSIELRQESFLWAEDLSSYDSIAQLPFSIPLYGDHVSLFTLMMAVSTFFYTRSNSSSMPSNPGMPNMKFMMYLFPFMMLFFFNSFAAGLSYYYFTANMMTILQMFIIKKYIIDEDKIRAKLQANKTKPKKKSKFQQRLEKMQKEQQMRQQNKKR